MCAAKKRPRCSAAPTTAALCGACDRRVHRANKVAGKHRRLSLSGSSAQSRPACDICQEKQGGTCSATRTGRFLGRDLRSTSAPQRQPSHHSTTGSSSLAPRISGRSLPCSPSLSRKRSADKANTKNHWRHHGPIKTSLGRRRLLTIASTCAATPTTAPAHLGVLINMCPGWRVEDLLVDDAAVVAMEDFSKGDDLPPFLGADLEAVAEKFPVWAPQVPQFPPPAPPAAATTTTRYQPWNTSKEAGRERWSEDLFAVPQISPASTPSKRPRHTPWYY
ncbi:hypothetical protein C4D60_Mb01t13010 [Musa balbisiana]|uniref:Uncharacterized protein n=1 Tax=Musa balbisiana TaxID=52838 RepID=A0A4S8JLU6_MUSBA|nr:hypothetical protein C4D60_Mb01t13010 [Musa balbisiana]